MNQIKQVRLRCEDGVDAFLQSHGCTYLVKSGINLKLKQSQDKLTEAIINELGDEMSPDGPEDHGYNSLHSRITKLLQESIK